MAAAEVASGGGGRGVVGLPQPARRVKRERRTKTGARMKEALAQDEIGSTLKKTSCKAGRMG